MKYHFVGIAGSGMSALAQLLRLSGDTVSGSDRSFDRSEQRPLSATLASLGIQITPQDGSGIQTDTDAVVISTAIEKDNPERTRANQLHVPLIRRGALLAQTMNPRFGIAVAGTSGKSTVAAMIATMLKTLGLDPTYYGGALLAGPQPGPGLSNAWRGKGDFFCAEADESDGSLLDLYPRIGVITNISKDHKDMDTLIDAFTRFAGQVRQTLILNADCPMTRSLKLPNIPICWYGTDTAQFPLRILKASAYGTEIEWKNTRVAISPGGMHNVSNALAALTLAEALHIPLPDAGHALETFHGIQRRSELIGTPQGIALFDDYAHNPAKIEATLATLQSFFDRVLIVFQLHGFGPARFMQSDLQRLFAQRLRQGDCLILPDIYDAGGTADRSIQAQDIARSIRSAGAKADVLHIAARPEIQDFLLSHAKANDAIVIMGARDPSLGTFARQIAQALDPAYTARTVA